MKNLFRVFLAFLIAIWKEALAPFQLVKVNYKLRHEPYHNNAIEVVTDDDLKTYLKEEGIRAKELDEKLQKVTAATSVAMSIGGLVGQAFVQNLAASPLKLFSTIILLVAMAMIVIGVVIGFDGLRPRPRYGYGLVFTKIQKDGGKEARAELETAAASFERDNIIRANQASAATSAIRNGIILYAIAVLVGLWSATVVPTDGKLAINISQPETTQPKQGTLQKLDKYKLNSPKT